MLKKILFFTFILTLVACNKGGKFSVSGNISGAENQTIYFDYNGLVKDSLIDSVKLDKNGSFKFKTNRPTYPDLFRIRLGAQQIILGADSTTQNIQIVANASDLIQAKIENSAASNDIQLLRKKVLTLQEEALTIGKEKDQIKQKNLLDSFSVNMDKHKKSVLDLIMKNPRSIAAYFALYQQINGLYIISPYDKKDRVYFSAVATAYDSYMPNYERSKSLHNLVIDALQQARNQKQAQIIAEMQKNVGLNFPEIELYDNKGSLRKLSDLKGKTILLDFSAVEMENSINYTFELREIYNAYSGSGLQIYQVSIDQNKMLWERTAANLPWICVRDVTGNAASVYNVQNLPTLFLIDKNGSIVSRYADFETLKRDLKRVI